MCKYNVGIKLYTSTFVNIKVMHELYKILKQECFIPYCMNFIEVLSQVNYLIVIMHPFLNILMKSAIFTYHIFVCFSGIMIIIIIKAGITYNK